MNILLFPFSDGKTLGTTMSFPLSREKLAKNVADFFDFENFAYLNQIHSGKVVVADNPVKGEDGDALLTFEKNIMLCVFTADCVPVYVYGDNFVGIIHAGWRGFVNGIFENFFEILKERDVDISLCGAVIGASICGKCYEVGKDVAEEFDAEFLKEKGNGKFFLDLKKCALKKLAGKGILEKNIYLSDLCTYHHACFPSYRRDRTEFRSVNFIGMKGDG